MRHEQVPPFLPHADVLVLPWRFEELGSVLLEGMVCRIPIVASDVKGMASVIEHERNGILVPAGDPRGFARVIDRVLNDPQPARGLAQHSRAAAERYSWSSLAQRIANNIYRSCP